MATQNGYFLIADITGYTQYLSASELDHAQKILASLLNLLISSTRPPLVISRLAGDAVISYGLGEGFLQGQTFVETLEDTYVAFRRAIDLMVRNTTCPCNACRNIGSLDLKFFVHYGEFGVQKLDAHDELVGSDVNLIHRLLKNHVAERTGFTAYTLFTDAAIRRLGLAEITATLVPNEEVYEHLGPVATWVQDMHPVWEARRREAQVRIAPADELMRFSIELALPPPLVWDYMVQPEHFNVLLHGDRLEVEARKAGKIAPGSIYQCYHGDAVISNTILEWHPFELVVVQYNVPVPIPGVTGLVEFQLEPTAMGTRFSQVMSRSRGPLAGRLLADSGLRKLRTQGQGDLAAFKAHVEAEAAGRLAGVPRAAAIPAAAIEAAARVSLTA